MDLRHNRDSASVRHCHPSRRRNVFLEPHPVVIIPIGIVLGVLFLIGWLSN